MLRRIFGERTEQAAEEDYVEVNMMGSPVETMAPGMASGVAAGKFGIKVEKLNDFSDTEKTLQSVRDGNIVFLKIKGLKEKDIGDLKRAVDKLKKSIMANNGDIVGVEQDWLILTPQSASVHRE